MALPPSSSLHPSQPPPVLQSFRTPPRPNSAQENFSSTLPPSYRYSRSHSLIYRLSSLLLSASSSSQCPSRYLSLTISRSRSRECKSCVQGRFDKYRRFDHNVFSDTVYAGGKWADNLVLAGWIFEPQAALKCYRCLDILSRNTIMTCRRKRYHIPLAVLREIAAYLKAYPLVLGIYDCVCTNVNINDVLMNNNGHHIGSRQVAYKNLVLVSGRFSSLIPS